MLFLIALCASLILTPIMRLICRKYALTRGPSEARRLRDKGTPRLGGVAIFASVSLALAALFVLNDFAALTTSLSRADLLMMVAPGMLVLLLGVYDDVRSASVQFKFLGQILAATLFFLLGGRIEILSVPFIGAVQLPPTLAFAVTLVWLVAVTNAFNLIDGIDGLATGAALSAAIVMVMVSVIFGHPAVTIVGLALGGALIGFLPYNFNPASIFLGDSGSLFIGFMLAALSIQGAQKSTTAVALAIPLLALGVPIFDTGFSVARRFISGRPLFARDREHIHYMLLARGWSERRVALVLYGVCVLFGCQALLFVFDRHGGRMAALSLFGFSAAMAFAVPRLRYHELDEIGASVKRNLSLAQRRLRTANNIRIRRACQAISKAGSLSEVFGAVEKMVEMSEFVYVTARINCRGQSGRQRLAQQAPRNSVAGFEANNGHLHWSWGRGDLSAVDIIESSRFWSLRLPLSTERAEWGYINFYRETDSEALLLDVSYLSKLFRKEMAVAVERVFDQEDSKSEIGETIADVVSLESRHSGKLPRIPRLPSGKTPTARGAACA
ncbi:MAG TPA: MraY family glycosyltransferase [Pyrinomonadaceae bacterium]